MATLCYRPGHLTRQNIFCVDSQLFVCFYFIHTLFHRWNYSFLSLISQKWFFKSLFFLNCQILLKIPEIPKLKKKNSFLESMLLISILFFVQIFILSLPNFIFFVFCFWYFCCRFVFPFIGTVYIRRHNDCLFLSNLHPRMYCLHLWHCDFQRSLYVRNVCVSAFDV